MIDKYLLFYTKNREGDKTNMSEGASSCSDKSINEMKAFPMTCDNKSHMYEWACYCSIFRKEVYYCQGQDMSLLLAKATLE